VSEASIAKPLRERLEHVPFFGKMVQCGYCAGHWIAAAMLLWLRPPLIIESWFVTWLVIVMLSAFQWALLRRIVGDD